MSKSCSVLFGINIGQLSMLLLPFYLHFPLLFMHCMCTYNFTLCTFAVSLQFYRVLITLGINTALGLVQTLKHLGCVYRDQRTSHREMMSPVEPRCPQLDLDPRKQKANHKKLFLLNSCLSGGSFKFTGQKFSSMWESSRDFAMNERLCKFRNTHNQEQP